MAASDPTPAGRQTWADYLDIIRRRRRAALLAGLLIVAGVASFALGLPPLYRASATILVEGAMRANTPDLPATGDVDARLQAIKEEALSRTRLTDLITRFGLYPNLRRGGAALDGALDQIQRDIRVESTSTQPINGQPSTIAFRLSYVGSDPKTAADVTNALASFYVAQNQSIQSQQAALSAESFKAQLDETKAKLDAQEARVRDYASHNSGALPQQVDASIAALTRLTAELQMNSEQQMQLMDRRESLQAQLAALDQAPLPANPSTNEARLQAAQRTLADLQASGATDQNPDVKAAKRDIATLTATVAKDGARAGAKPDAAPPPSQRATLEANLKEADAGIARLDAGNKTLRSSLDGYESRVEGSPGRGPEFDMLMRDYQGTRDLYDTAQRKYNDALLAVRADKIDQGEQFKILDAAVVPSQSAGPNTSHLLTLAAILAIIVAFATAVIADRLDSSFHGIEDLRAFTRVPVLTSIPPIRTSRDAWSDRGRFGAIAALSVGILAAVAFQAFLLGHRSEDIARLLLRVS